MISSLLALTLLASAAQPQDPTVPARQDYVRCLDAFMRATVEQRMEPAAFDAALAQQCSDRAGVFRASVIRRERAAGNRARAEEDARMQLDDAQVNIRELYRMFMESQPPQSD